MRCALQSLQSPLQSERKINSLIFLITGWSQKLGYDLLSVTFKFESSTKLFCKLFNFMNTTWPKRKSVCYSRSMGTIVCDIHVKPDSCLNVWSIAPKIHVKRQLAAVTFQETFERFTRNLQRQLNFNFKLESISLRPFKLNFLTFLTVCFSLFWT